MCIITRARALALAATLALTACTTTSTAPTAQSASQPQGSVNVGYIAVEAGFDIESRVAHLPSSAQIVWLHENYDRLAREGFVQTGAQVQIVAYGNNNTDVIWSDETISSGQRRAQMPLSVMRATDVICARVTGYRIVNVENVQISHDGTTSSWCESEFAQFADEPWMRGANGGFGFPLILEPLQ